MKIIIILLALMIGWLKADRSDKVESGHLIKSRFHFSVIAPAKEIIGNYSTAKNLIQIDKNGRVQAQVHVDSFEFSNNFVTEEMNQKIQERFQRHYMESSTYPFISFKGEINKFSDIDFKSHSRVPLEVKGSLTIHGVTQEIFFTAYLEMIDSVKKISATISVIPQEYKIPIPPHIGSMDFKKVNITIETYL